MGWEHVVPQFVKRLHDLSKSQPNGLIQFPLQGDGSETRSFCFIDDFIDGVALLQAKGEHLNVYHIGTLEEVPMGVLAHLVAESIQREINIVPGTLLQGSVARRCPDIRKIEALGYNPKIMLRAGVATSVDWYLQNVSLMPPQSN
jgi:nucleoside-diphosphate-sugar epimerase